MVHLKSLIMRMLSHHFPKFLIVGIASTIINYFVFFLFFSFFETNYLISFVLGYLSGVLFGFYANRKWTFVANTKEFTPEIIKYLIIYSCSLLLGLGLISFQVNIVKINPLIANLFTLAFTTIFNFIGTKYFVFVVFKKKDINFLIYRYRYLINYIFIGFGSILLEMFFIILFSSLIKSNIYLISFFGFILGVIFSYILNSKLNFYVPDKKKIKTFKIFLFISFFSYILNLILYFVLSYFFIYPYSSLRFITAALIFVISYSLHRKFTFTDLKLVGVAIYLSKKENLNLIWSKISNYPDFIHIDLVDETYNSNHEEIDLSIGFEIKKKWFGIKTMTHIMSKYPSRWINQVNPFSDVIIFHSEINENINHIIKLIQLNNKKVGLTIFYSTPIDKIKEYFGDIDFVQILGIEKPGVSGQYLQQEAINKLDELQKIKIQGGYSFEICFDGGVKRENINILNAKYVVSASSILNSDSPVTAMFDLKTSSRYYSKYSSLKLFLTKKIFENTNDLEFVKSNTIVGSFIDKEDLTGISDIDIIIILDKLTKEKYDCIIHKFEMLKKIVETDYNLSVKINDTFGPLKFDDHFDIVFHLMIYDIKLHLDHCVNSPFTVLDWEKSNIYSKLKMQDIVKTFAPQPNQLINSRRSVETYLKDLKENVITYRKYDFSSKTIVELSLKKEMTEKDRLEYVYHIYKFLILNFMKIYTTNNLEFSSKIVDSFFEITGIHKKHHHFFNKLENYKHNKKKFGINSKELSTLSMFLNDYKMAFESLFYGHKKINVVRHQRTRLNKEGYFLGRKKDVSIFPISKKEQLILFNSLKGFEVIYSSPLKRAIETARILNISEKEIILNNYLLEIDYGDVDGKDIKYLHKFYPAIINQWNQKEDASFPNGENHNSVQKRITIFLNLLYSLEYKTFLIVTHNVIIRVLIGISLNIPFHLWYKIKINHLEYIAFILSKNNKLYLNVNAEKIKEIYYEVYNGN